MSTNSSSSNNRKVNNPSSSVGETSEFLRHKKSHKEESAVDLTTENDVEMVDKYSQPDEVKENSQENTPVKNDSSTRVVKKIEEEKEEVKMQQTNFTEMEEDTKQSMDDTRQRDPYHIIAVAKALLSGIGIINGKYMNENTLNDLCSCVEFTDDPNDCIALSSVIVQFIASSLQNRGYNRITITQNQRLRNVVEIIKKNPQLFKSMETCYENDFGAIVQIALEEYNINEGLLKEIINNLLFAKNDRNV